MVEALAQECGNELTAQLMSSPLQATFMATVAAARGTPSKSRWDLFHSYYQTIYQRELQKKVEPLDAVLRDHPDLIERLHHDIGFLLQLRGETAADQGAALSLDEFRRLVLKYLEDAGFRGHELSQLVCTVGDLAETRLLLLTSRVKGELTFDVRSLQEYMAAECLMTPGADGEIGPVKARLMRLAPLGYWRNVFLFAADKCFTQAACRGLVDPLRLFCADLNENPDQLLKMTRAGSELALDILHGAAVVSKPEPSRQLARIALALLSTTYEPEHISRLVTVYRGYLAGVYREEIELRIGHLDRMRTVATWALLVRLLEQGVEWAENLIQRFWPKSPEERGRVLRGLAPWCFGTLWVRAQLAEVTPYLSPRFASSFILLADTEGTLVNDKANIYRIFSDSIRYIVALDRISPSIRFYTFLINTVDIESVLLVADTVNWHHHGWLAFSLVPHFIRSPNKETLAKILRLCVEKECLDPHSFGYYLPWPLFACFEAADASPAELLRLAAAAERGELGDADDWSFAERRWMSVGITPADLVRAPGALPFTGEIRNCGFVAIGGSLRHPIKAPSRDQLSTLWSVAEQANSHAVRRACIRYLCTSTQGVELLLSNNIDKLIDIIRSTNIEINAILNNHALHNSLANFLNTLGCLPNWRLAHIEPDKSESIQFLERHYVADPTCRGLLRILAAAASIGWEINAQVGRFSSLAATDPADRLAAVILRLAHQQLIEPDTGALVEAVASLPTALAGPLSVDLVFATIQNHPQIVPAQINFLVQLHDRCAGINAQMQLACVAQLRRARQSRTSDLNSPGKLANLQLPVGAPDGEG